MVKIKNELYETVVQTEDFQNLFQHIFDKTVLKFFDTYQSSGIIKYQVDKWGYFDGLLTDFSIDNVKRSLKSELLKMDKTNKLSPSEIEELISLFDLSDLKEILSISVQKELLHLFPPYDLQLANNTSIIDTIELQIPLFEIPIKCQRKV